MIDPTKMEIVQEVAAKVVMETNEEICEECELEELEW